MKTITKLALISLFAAAAIGATSAEARNKKGDFVQNTPEGMKFYSKHCINDGAYCGNWNVNG